MRYFFFNSFLFVSLAVFSFAIYADDSRVGQEDIKCDEVHKDLNNEISRLKKSEKELKEQIQSKQEIADNKGSWATFDRMLVIIFLGGMAAMKQQNIYVGIVISCFLLYRSMCNNFDQKCIICDINCTKKWLDYTVSERKKLECQQLKTLASVCKK